MKEGQGVRIRKEIEKRYHERTPRSRNLFRRAQKYLPGGDTRSVTYFDPYPVYIDRAIGCYLFDVDGNRYLDVLNNFTSLILGHCHPRVIQAIRDQAAKGSVFGAPIEEQYRLAL